MKNKFFSSILISLILISVISFNAFAVQLGDVDADGNVTASDARITLRYSVGLEKLSSDEVFRADIDSDGGIYAADARTILRIAVGLTASRYIDNQYDMIRSGVYEYMGERLDISTGKYEYFELAKTTDTVHLLTSFENVEIAVFIKDNTVYTVSHEKKMYLVTPDEVFSAIGTDKNELLSKTDMTDVDYPALNEAYSVKDSFVEDFQCKLYLINTENGVLEVAMCGKKLIRIREFDTDGKLAAATKFYSVSMVVPSYKKAIPSDYKKYEGKLQAITFVGELLK